MELDRTIYRLTYFNGRGRAEVTRLLFAAAGVGYEDRRITAEEWAKMKPYTPWNTLPILEVEGNVIGQSVAVARYIAKETGLAGHTYYEQALIDSVMDRITELRDKVLKLEFTPDSMYKNEAIQDFEDHACPAIIPTLNKFLERNPYDSGFFVGKSISVADIYFFSTIENLMPNMPDVLVRHPRLEDLYDRVRTHPSIADYLARRPLTLF